MNKQLKQLKQHNQHKQRNMCDCVACTTNWDVQTKKVLYSCCDPISQMYFDSTINHMLNYIPCDLIILLLINYERDLYDGT